MELNALAEVKRILGFTFRDFESNCQSGHELTTFIVIEKAINTFGTDLAMFGR